MLLLLILLPAVVWAWPDGAPCVTNAYESMNPLEAIEHHGGLQLTEPPYEIKVDQRCYWRSQPIAFTLQGKNESVWYKGFAIQPFVWNNGLLGKRIGRILRLDDNGSWQYQCFRFKNSVTHSHNQRKKQMKMWWRNDDSEEPIVQLVATVVHSQRKFWVKSVLSPPIPPCRSRREIKNWVPPLPAAPPPVKTFKEETDREFGNFFISERGPEDGNSINNHNRLQKREKRDKLTTIIPMPGMTVQHAHGVITATGQTEMHIFGGRATTPSAPPSTSFAFNFQQQQEQQRQLEQERQRSLERARQMERERLERERLRQPQRTLPPAPLIPQPIASSLRSNPQPSESSVSSTSQAASPRPSTNAVFRPPSTVTPFHSTVQFSSTSPTSLTTTFSRQQVLNNKARSQSTHLKRLRTSIGRKTTSPREVRPRTRKQNARPSNAAARIGPPNTGVCSDLDPPSRCVPWAQYCQASTYMHQYCKKTCNFC